MKKQTFTLFNVFLSILSISFIPLEGEASIQDVTVGGSVHNSSSGSGKAQMNIGSSIGKNIGNNTQTVVVNGDLTNKASGSGQAIINIGSVVNDGGSHSQSVSVGGSIVNSSSGGKSEVNIGSVVKD